MSVTSLLTLVSCATLTAADSSAVLKARELNDLTSLSLEELGSIQVTSVSKKSENLNKVPAAVSVITGDDIRRSGALTLPEVLRMAPGVSVAKVDATQTAVTVRGFNDTFAQKLLVLMDGRSIYTPLFSGTFWQAQDTMLEDVDRIEVIRGPGGTVWGANAVNGVISIVSKPARETQGVLLSGGGGSEQLALAGVRYGGQLGTNTFFRIYGKYDDRDNSQLVGGGDAKDGWSKGQGGFRLDWEPSTSDRLTLQGDLFELRANQTYAQVALPAFGVPPPLLGYNSVREAHPEQSGGNVLGRWSHQFSEDSDLSVQAYYDRSDIRFPVLEETRDTFDLDLRHRFQPGSRQEIVWGGGYRVSDSHLMDSVEIALSRKSRSDRVFNAFAQDEITLVPDRLLWTLGTKVEHNDYTGFEVQPGTRLSWTPTDKQTVWASVARAVRTPSQLEHDGRFNVVVIPPSLMLPLPTLVSVIGNPGFESEMLLAYELGYRIQAHRRLTLDAAVFINDYDNLRSSVERLDLSTVPNYAQVQSIINNDVHGLTYGGELAATFQAIDWWRLHGQISAIQADIRQLPNGLTGTPRTPSIASPEYELSLRSSMDLGKSLTLDGSLRYVDRIAEAGIPIPGLPNAGYSIPSYFTFDARLAWRPTKGLELALIGQNLAGRHREFVPTVLSTQFTEVGPSVYAKLTWMF